MTHIKNILLLALLFLLANDILAQDASKALNILKQTRLYNSDLQVDTQYNLYKGYDGKTPVETYTGVYCKKGEYIYSKIGNAEIITSPSFYIKVNHDEKAILIADPAPQNKAQLDNGLTQLLDYVKVSKFEDHGSYWYIKLEAKPITQLSYSAIELEITKHTHFFKRIVFYYFGQIDFSENGKKADVAQPKLEIVYSHYRTKKFNVSTSKFRLSSYVIKDKGKYQAAKRLLNYEVINSKKINN